MSVKNNFYKNDVVIVENFLDMNSCASLSNWIENNLNTNIFKDANMGGKRVTSRYTNSDFFEFPEIAHETRKSIISHFKFKNFLIPPFKDGIVASCAFPGDTCYSHIDPVWHNKHYTLHCNVIVSEPESGGNVIFDEEKYKMNIGNLFCYPVSKLRHGTDIITGNKNRMMFVFGFCIPNDTIYYNNLI